MKVNTLVKPLQIFCSGHLAASASAGIVAERHIATTYWITANFFRFVTLSTIVFPDSVGTAAETEGFSLAEAISVALLRRSKSKQLLSLCLCRKWETAKKRSASESNVSSSGERILVHEEKRQKLKLSAGGNVVIIITNYYVIIIITI